MSIIIFHFTGKQNEQNFIANSEMKTVLLLNEVTQSLRIVPFPFITLYTIMGLVSFHKPLFYAVNIKVV